MSIVDRVFRVTGGGAGWRAVAAGLTNMTSPVPALCVTKSSSKDMHIGDYSAALSYPIVLIKTYVRR